MHLVEKDEPTCECVAAWVDTHPCICGEPEGLPMPLNTDRLKEANNIIGKLERLKSELELTKKLSGKLPGRFGLSDEKVVRPSYSGHSLWSDRNGNSVKDIGLKIPVEMVQSLLRTKIAETFAELQATGIVSAQQSPIRQVIE